MLHFCFWRSIWINDAFFNFKWYVCIFEVNRWSFHYFFLIGVWSGVRAGLRRHHRNEGKIWTHRSFKIWTCLSVPIILVQQQIHHFHLRVFHQLFILTLIVICTALPQWVWLVYHVIKYHYLQLFLKFFCSLSLLLWRCRLKIWRLHYSSRTNTSLAIISVVKGCESTGGILFVLNSIICTGKLVSRYQ